MTESGRFKRVAETPEGRVAVLVAALEEAASHGVPFGTADAAKLLGVSRPTARAALRQAQERLSVEVVASRGGRRPGAKQRESREARVTALMEALERAAALGQTVSPQQAIELLGVSPPTARADLQEARARLGIERIQTAKAELVAVEGPHVTVEPMPRSVTVERAQAIATGVDMMGILARVGDDLDRVVREVGSDLEQVRFWLMGGDAGHQLPGRCITCNQQLADRINRQTPPALIGNLGVNDLGRMYDSLIKALRALTEVAAEKNAVLEQFYHYQALQNFMTHTEQAIKEIAPHLAVAIAKRVRELGERA